jgi:tRNA threonylcarbamoyladenosine biosynthesis protein TsaE
LAAILETTLHWPDEAAAQASAARLAPALLTLPLAIVDLYGSLGSGKTTFARLLLRELGVTGRIKSPSYTVVEPYPLASGRMAHHFDFYRFEHPDEFEAAGFRDIFATTPGLILMEWPERVAGKVPAGHLRLMLEINDDGSRRVGVIGVAALVEALA